MSLRHGRVKTYLNRLTRIDTLTSGPERVFPWNLRMPTPNDSPITHLLVATGDGDESARTQLWTVIYGELRRLASHQMSAEAGGHTLQPTALVHEAFFRLFDGKDVDWANRRHFFGAAARAMRRIRIDDARKRKRLKRGGEQQRVSLDDAPAFFQQDPTEALAVDEALERLEQEDSRKAEVVMLRYFVGMTEEETAAALGISRRAVQGDWRVARAWLHRELSKGDTSIRRG